MRTIEHAWIPMPDGCRLAARIWLPDDAMEHPVPAILEYIPYRKNDATAPRDAAMHPYFADHGYASVRVDMRGSGDSDGLLLDEYLVEEQDDGVAVISWLAAQPWCAGTVGMIGKSWGGFNGLQIAARRPPALRAVVTVCSTDDRYADDVHYRGGCLLGSEMLPWAATMLAANARPPDPAVVGERWRASWHERMERTAPFIDAWLSHQRRDTYWRHGSVCEDFGAISCPVYAVGGWADGYSDAVGRLLAGLRSPRKGLIGPWAHTYPHEGVPGPAIGFLQECLRWWDCWLKDGDTGIMDEPMLCVWMPAPDGGNGGEDAGRWIAEPVWPPPETQRLSLGLGDGTLGDGANLALRIRGAQACGLDAGAFFSGGEPVHLPGDQRTDDGHSLTFTSAPLDQPTEILGAPEAVLRIAANRPLAAISVRLCDVASDGASRLVTRGLLNLAHRNGHEAPESLEPGVSYAVAVRLGTIAHAFGPGHRIRLAVSPTYWPWAWPSPESVALTVHAGGSELKLPVRIPRPEDRELSPFGPAQAAPATEVRALHRGRQRRTTRRDLASARHELIVDHDDCGLLRLSDGLEYSSRGQDRFAIVEGQPLSASVQSDRTITLSRSAWRVRIETTSSMTADARAFHLRDTLRGYELDDLVFERTWRRSVARDHI